MTQFQALHSLGMAIFSTRAGKYRPRLAISNMSVVMRSDKNDDRDTMAANLKTQFPGICKGITMDINVYDYFDHYDQQLHGSEFLRAVLHYIADSNAIKAGEAQDLARRWMATNKETFALLGPEHLAEHLFTEEDKSEYETEVLEDAWKEIQHQRQTLTQMPTFNLLPSDRPALPTSRVTSNPEHTQIRQRPGLLREIPPSPFSHFPFQQGRRPQSRFTRNAETLEHIHPGSTNRGDFHGDPLMGAFPPSMGYNMANMAVPSRGLPGPFSYLPQPRVPLPERRKNHDYNVQPKSKRNPTKRSSDDVRRGSYGSSSHRQSSNHGYSIHGATQLAQSPQPLAPFHQGQTTSLQIGAAFPGDANQGRHMSNRSPGQHAQAMVLHGLPEGSQQFGHHPPIQAQEAGNQSMDPYTFGHQFNQLQPLHQNPLNVTVGEHHFPSSTKANDSRPQSHQAPRQFEKRGSPRRGREYSKDSRIWIGNIPRDFDRHQIERLLQPCRGLQEIIEPKISLPPDHKSRYIFAQFHTKDEAEEALDRLPQTQFDDLGEGNFVKASWAFRFFPNQKTYNVNVESTTLHNMPTTIRESRLSEGSIEFEAGQEDSEKRTQSIVKTSEAASAGAPELDLDQRPIQVDQIEDRASPLSLQALNDGTNESLAVAKPMVKIPTMATTRSRGQKSKSSNKVRDSETQHSRAMSFSENTNPVAKSEARTTSMTKNFLGVAAHPNSKDDAAQASSEEINATNSTAALDPPVSSTSTPAAQLLNDSLNLALLSEDSPHQAKTAPKAQASVPITDSLNQADLGESTRLAGPDIDPRSETSPSEKQQRASAVSKPLTTDFATESSKPSDLKTPQNDHKELAAQNMSRDGSNAMYVDECNISVYQSSTAPTSYLQTERSNSLADEFRTSTNHPDEPIAIIKNTGIDPEQLRTKLATSAIDRAAPRGRTPKQAPAIPTRSSSLSRDPAPIETRRRKKAKKFAPVEERASSSNSRGPPSVIGERPKDVGTHSSGLMKPSSSLRTPSPGKSRNLPEPETPFKLDTEIALPKEVGHRQHASQDSDLSLEENAARSNERRPYARFGTPQSGNTLNQASKKLEQVLEDAGYRTSIAPSSARHFFVKDPDLARLDSMFEQEEQSKECEAEDDRVHFKEKGNTFIMSRDELEEQMELKPILGQAAAARRVTGALIPRTPVKDAIGKDRKAGTTMSIKSLCDQIQRIASQNIYIKATRGERDVGNSPEDRKAKEAKALLDISPKHSSSTDSSVVWLNRAERWIEHNKMSVSPPSTPTRNSKVGDVKQLPSSAEGCARKQGNAPKQVPIVITSPGSKTAIIKLKPEEDASHVTAKHLANIDSLMGTGKFESVVPKRSLHQASSESDGGAFTPPTPETQGRRSPSEERRNRAQVEGVSSPEHTHHKQDKIAPEDIAYAREELTVMNPEAHADDQQENDVASSPRTILGDSADAESMTIVASVFGSESDDTFERACADDGYPNLPPPSGSHMRGAKTRAPSRGGYAAAARRSIDEKRENDGKEGKEEKKKNSSPKKDLWALEDGRPWGRPGKTEGRSTWAGRGATSGNQSLH